VTSRGDVVGGASAGLVGPVLDTSDLGRSVLEAILKLNPGARVSDRGAYCRVQAEGPCVLTSLAVEELTGHSFQLPGDLERVMPAFQGFLRLSAGRAEWTSERP
jgi:hypothetical protein